MSTPSWIGTSLSGRYKIEALLGQGGMSSVYKGADPNLRRTIAIKLIHPHLAADPEFVRRFEAEAAAVAQLRHPNIIQVYDFNHDGGTYYMVLEYLTGATLQQTLRALSAAGRRMPVAEIARIMAAVADAVHYAHQQGMIHRDLKPANVMINPSGQPTLMDFGVAKMLSGQQHTATGAVIGTPAYISPEQVRGERPDGRADIYSMGIMLFELVAGRPPFEADSAITLMMMHLNNPVPDLRQIAADTPDGLIAIIHKALAKQPEDRYQSAAELAAALRALPLSAPATVVESKRPAVPATLVESAPRVTPPPPPTPAPPPAQRSTPPPPVAPAAAPVGQPKASPAAPRQKAGLSPWLVGCGVLAVVGVVGLIIGGILSVSRAFGKATAVATAARVATTQPPANTQASPAAASPATQAAVAIASPTATEAPSVPVPDGMALIPAGFFQMGSDLSNESPLHPVLLEDFYIDTYEVTNAQYRACVEAGACSKPASRRNVDQAFDAFPVTGVTWPQANVYCKSRGDRLPTEAEWEYAAGGPEHLRWPWGNKFDASLSAASAADVQPVGSYPGGASPFGLLDMAGNVAEWVWDTYSPDYYANATALNPENSAPNEPHIYRGGSYANTDGAFYTTTHRYINAKGNGFYDTDIGFRCAQSAVAETRRRSAADRVALLANFCALYTSYKPGATCP